MDKRDAYRRTHKARCRGTPFPAWRRLTLIRVGVLRAAGFRLDPTGRNPRHFTVVFDDLDRGVDALVSCEHHIWANPYHEG